MGFYRLIPMQTVTKCEIRQFWFLQLLDYIKWKCSLFSGAVSYKVTNTEVSPPFCVPSCMSYSSLSSPSLSVLHQSLFLKAPLLIAVSLKWLHAIQMQRDCEGCRGEYSSQKLHSSEHLPLHLYVDIFPQRQGLHRLRPII